MTHHSFLIILRFNKEDQLNPLRCGVIDQGDRFKRMSQAQASLVVGVVDPSLRSAMTPMMMISLNGRTLQAYNRVVEQVEELNRLYRGENGYLLHPASLNRTQSKMVQDKIYFIGSKIFDLLRSSPESDAVCKWLDDLFRHYERDEPRFGGTAVHHVTIVTNDFSIPWYWLRAAGHEQFLCEIVALGMLQLSSYSAGYRGDADSVWRSRVAEKDVFSALLINGSPELPFARAELDAVRSGLGGDRNDENGHASRVIAEEVSSKEMLLKLRGRTEYGQRVEQYRLVHFTGHYSSEALMINGMAVEPREELDQFIDRSVLVLDGCSSSEGLKAWTDMDTVTSRLIQVGAVGCVVTALPLKNDPLIAEWFWKAFYEEIRVKGVSVGQALRHARAVLKQRMEDMNLCNPAWMLYQLVGNPTVDLFTESTEWAGPR
jgi:hypothetical protein